MGFLLEKNEREGPKPPDSNPRKYLEPNRSTRPAAFGPIKPMAFEAICAKRIEPTTPASNAE